MNLVLAVAGLCMLGYAAYMFIDFENITFSSEADSGKHHNVAHWLIAAKENASPWYGRGLLLLASLCSQANLKLSNRAAVTEVTRLPLLTSAKYCLQVHLCIWWRWSIPVFDSRFGPVWGLLQQSFLPQLLLNNGGGNAAGTMRTAGGLLC